MLRRYLKAQVGVLLGGGLVGPIFLAVYFGAGADDELKWMFYTGLLVSAADVLVALALTNSGLKSAARSAAWSAALEKDGVLALARITGIIETGARVNDVPLVELRLRISGTGFTAFDGVDVVAAGVSRLGNITAGKLVVLVDPGTQQYRIDWERSALVNGLMPAQFTFAEDGGVHDLTGQADPLMKIMRLLKANDVALQDLVDVRSNPVLRQQIQEVVQGAVASAALCGGPAGPASESPIGERLQQLEVLRRSGVLTELEYARKRAQLIAEI